MVTTLSLRARAATVVAASALVLAAGAAPAWAADPMPGSANDTVMTPGQAVLVFVGIPFLVAGIIWLLVLAPGWTRSGRASSAEAWTSDPLVLGSVEATEASEASPELASAAGAAEDEAGGTSATW